ncbi:MAG: hypothetical protein WC780_08685 [Lentimicrobiaceae bacterium]|jgi:hypothetical protein
MKILPILTSCAMRMEHKHLQQLRSETLLSLLKVERENNKKPIPVNKNFTVVQMMNDMQF